MSMNMVRHIQLLEKLAERGPDPLDAKMKRWRRSQLESAAGLGNPEARDELAQARQNEGAVTANNASNRRSALRAKAEPALAAFGAARTKRLKGVQEDRAASLWRSEIKAGRSTLGQVPAKLRDAVSKAPPRPPMNFSEKETRTAQQAGLPAGANLTRYDDKRQAPQAAPAPGASKQPVAPVAGKPAAPVAGKTAPAAAPAAGGSGQAAPWSRAEQTLGRSFAGRSPAEKAKLTQDAAKWGKGSNAKQPPGSSGTPAAGAPAAAPGEHFTSYSRLAQRINDKHGGKTSGAALAKRFGGKMIFGGKDDKTKTKFDVGALAQELKSGKGGAFGPNQFVTGGRMGSQGSFSRWEASKAKAQQQTAVAKAPAKAMAPNVRPKPVSTSQPSVASGVHPLQSKNSRFVVTSDAPTSPGFGARKAPVQVAKPAAPARQPAPRPSAPAPRPAGRPGVMSPVAGSARHTGTGGASARIGPVQTRSPAVATNTGTRGTRGPGTGLMPRRPAASPAVMNAVAGSSRRGGGASVGIGPVQTSSKTAPVNLGTRGNRVPPAAPSAVAKAMAPRAPRPTRPGELPKPGTT